MRRNSRSGPPALLAFLLAAALVFGVYYIWQGVQTFLRTGGLGVVEVDGARGASRYGDGAGRHAHERRCPRLCCRPPPRRRPVRIFA